MHDGKVIEGFVILDKHPKCFARQPRPFWLEMQGITGSSTWVEVLWRTIGDVSEQRFILSEQSEQRFILSEQSEQRFILSEQSEQRFIFRVFKDRRADQSEGFLDGPLRSGHGLVAAIQLMLQKACGLAQSESEVFTLHGPRHFLPEVALARGEPET